MMVHPFSDPEVMAGNATIGLEILEDLPDVDAVVIAYAGGGLSCGIASVIRALRPEVKLYAAEVSTGAPFAASLAKGSPVVIDYEPTFVDGIGAPRVFNEMFELASSLLDGSLVSTPEEIADAVRLIAEGNHVICRGCGRGVRGRGAGGQGGNGQGGVRGVGREYRRQQAGEDTAGGSAVETISKLGFDKLRAVAPNMW